MKVEVKLAGGGKGGVNLFRSLTGRLGDLGQRDD